MPLESYIEREACRRIQLLLKNPDATPKHGKDGWPDRQVLLGRGIHFWFEFKQEKGRLRAAQVERRRRLEAQGDLVYAPRSVEEALLQYFEACRRLGGPAAA